MLANTLNTNEVKDSTGAEVEFTRLSTGPGRNTEFAKVGETYSLPYRLTISHEEIGSGSAARRRSKIGFSKAVVGTSGETRKCLCYLVLDAPIGDMSTSTEVKNVIANLMSLVSTTGAATTVLFDCTGNGALVLTNGDL